MSKVQDVKKSSLTFAPEAGTQRMRDVINKGLTIDDILGGATTAFQGGWNKVKLYFMLGLPTETKEDIEGIAVLSNEIAKAYYETVPKEKRNRKVQIVTSTSFFIPKPFTPFQWAQMNTRDEFWKRHILSGMRSRASSTRRVSNTTGTKQIFRNWKASLPVATESFAVSFTVLTKKGCIFDAWSEYFKNDIWLETFAEEGIDPAFYTTRYRSDDEIFPWDFISCGVTKAFLLREWKKSESGDRIAKLPDGMSGLWCSQIWCRRLQGALKQEAIYQNESQN